MNLIQLHIDFCFCYRGDFFSDMYINEPYLINYSMTGRLCDVSGTKYETFPSFKRKITSHEIIITNFRANFVCSTHCLKKLCYDIHRNGFTLYCIWIVEYSCHYYNPIAILTRNIRFFNVCVPFTTAKT